VTYIYILDILDVKASKLQLVG